MRAVDCIVKKRDGGSLTRDELDWLIDGYTAGRIGDEQMAAWAMAVVLRGMDDRETADLTLAMARSGEQLDVHDIAPLTVDKHSTGDGIVSALQVLQACVGSGKTMAQLLEGITLFPQTLINVKLQAGQDWRSNPRLASEARAVEAELGSRGRVLIRASGTEPLLRVMVEAADPDVAKASAQRLVDAVQAS